ncbi:hypothetical protein [Nocardia sp. NPDC051750]|uniref:hypothetical protein n=1 Tax=Nocardia sp. NPDC051750 TaxID=3364325 RepID=UPI0037AAB030
MKRVFFVLFAALFVSLVPVGVATAETGTHTNSGSCSGQTLSWGYFYAYTYQYAYVVNGKFQNESHNFNFNGFLDGANDADFAYGMDKKWMVYRSGDFDIAVPYIEGAGLFVKDNRTRDNEWIKLCSY